MTISLIPTLHCTGYEDTGTIFLAFRLSTSRDESVERSAYYPDTSGGRDLVKRMQYAFRKGLLFRIKSIPSTATRNDGYNHSDDALAKPTYDISSVVPLCTSWICPCQVGNNHQDASTRERFETNFARANRRLNRLEIPAADRLTEEGQMRYANALATDAAAALKKTPPATH